MKKLLSLILALTLFLPVAYASELPDQNVQRHNIMTADTIFPTD